MPDFDVTFRISREDEAAARKTIVSMQSAMHFCLGSDAPCSYAFRRNEDQELMIPVQMPEFDSAAHDGNKVDGSWDPLAEYRPEGGPEGMATPHHVGGTLRCTVLIGKHEAARQCALAKGHEGDHE